MTAPHGVRCRGGPAGGVDVGRRRRGRGEHVGTRDGQPPGAPAALPENALVTLGVQAGPPPVANRTGISTTLKVGDDLYQIDCGLGSLNAFTNAGFTFDGLRSMFITHLHTDHMVDYWSFFLSGGYTASKGKAPVTVYGPGSAGGLPPSRVGAADPPTIDAADPTPGLAATTHALQQAFAYTNNIFMRDMGTDDIERLIDVVEIRFHRGRTFRTGRRRRRRFR